MKTLKNNTKTIIAFNIYVVAILLVISAIIYLSEYKKHEKVFDSFSTNVTEQTAEILELWLEEQVFIAKSIAIDSKIVDVCVDTTELNVTRAKSLVEFVHSATDFYQYISISYINNNEDNSIDEENLNSEDNIVDDEGINSEDNINTENFKIVAIDSVNGEYVGSEIFQSIDYDVFIENNNIEISNVFSSKLWKEDIIEIGIPIESENEQVGILVFGLEMSYYTKNYLTEIKFGETGSISLLDNNGKIIAHTFKEQFEMIFEEDPDTFQLLMDTIGEKVLAGESTFNESFLGIRRRYNVRKVDNEYFTNHNWYIVFNQDYDEIFASVIYLKRILIVTILSFLVIGTIIMKFTLRYYSEKIEINR